MNPASDRLEKLKQNATVTGIDFISILPDNAQLTVDVHFYEFDAPSTVLIQTLLSDLAPGDIRIYNPDGVVADVPVDTVTWQSDHVFRILVKHRGDFTFYKLLINDRKTPGAPYRIDPYYNDVTFSFKANCPSDLDCKPAGDECLPDDVVDFPIDYLARDFWSYRQALLEFASLRYPDWPDRLAADAGVMLAELMSATGDEMAYYQDRIGREAYLETATQRRSIRRHARLVDYTIHDGLGATVWIDVTANSTGSIPVGRSLSAQGQNGRSINFEFGTGLHDPVLGGIYKVASASNQFDVYRWDENQLCLPVGSTECYIKDWNAANLKTFAGMGPDNDNGKWVLLKTLPTNPAQPAKACMVRLISAINMLDPVFSQKVTQLTWDAAQALPFEMDMTIMVVRGNMVPATAGKTYAQYFITGAELTELTTIEQITLQIQAEHDRADVLRAIERVGSNSTVSYLSTLENSETDNLVWLGTDATQSTPEIQLDQLTLNAIGDWVPDTSVQPWEWQRSLIGVNSSGSDATHYTLDDGSWRRVAGFWRRGNEIVHQDYASGSGSTIRFGDDEFGAIPAAKTVFKVTYRLGSGRLCNVAPETITSFDSTLGFITAVTNPLSSINGVDPETANEVRQSAPEAFRTITYRAVRPEDYADAAERLSWVENAGAAFRWTGSWLSVFVTPDPRDAVIMTQEWRSELNDQLNRYRQAGREAYEEDAVYADIDLDIVVCVSPDAYTGDTEQQILIQLFGKTGVLPIIGFFNPDRFTFGDPLERSALEAAIQSVPGVKAVESIQYRRRGFFDWKDFTDYYYDSGKQSIIRIENDPLHPERGILKLHVHGGA